MSYKYSIPKRQREGEVYTAAELYKEYQPVYIKLLIMRGQEPADAWDICHDAFEKILKKWDTLVWENIEKFLSRLLYNAVVDHYNDFKKKDYQTGGSDIVEMIDEKLLTDPMAEYTRGEFRKTLQDALTTLSKKEKEMFFGFYLEGKSVKELRNGKPIGCVVTPLARARAKVYAYFEKNYEKDET